MADKEIEWQFEVLIRGRRVEARSYKEGFRDAWYEATILETYLLTSKRILVRYHSLSCPQLLPNSDLRIPLEEYVYYNFIRPLPLPADPNTAFEERDMVDAFYLGGWRQGVISKVAVLKENTKYTKSYTVVFDNPSGQIDFAPSTLRLHLDWIDGKWVRSEKKQDISIGEFSQEQLGQAKNAKSFELTSLLGYSNTERNNIVEKIPPQTSGKNPIQLSAHCIKKPTRKEVKLSEPTSEAKLLYPSKKFRRESFANPASFPVCHEKVVSNDRPNQTALVTSSTLKNCSNHPVVCGLSSNGYQSAFTGRHVGINVHEEGDASQQQKVIMSNKINIEEDLQNGQGSKKQVELPTSALEPLGKEQNAIRRGGSGIEGFEESARKEGDLPIDMVAIDSEECAAEDCELPTTTGVPGLEPIGQSTAKAVDHCNDARNGQVKKEMDSSVIDVSANSALAENQGMPFVKSSSIWKTFESQEVFQWLPQKPHFHPLVKCKEVDREGLAIGQMVTFGNLVEKTSKLQVGDPREIFDCYLESFAVLEMHGFNVKPVVQRLNKLLSAKVRRELLHHQLEEIHIQTTALQTAASLIKADISIVEGEFGNLVAGCWKSA